MQIGTGGALRITDHLLDDCESRFAGATALDVARVHGRDYVVAGGADDGISVYLLQENGVLLERAHLADTPDITLGNVGTIATRADATGFDIFVAGDEPGLTRLRFEVGPAGDTLTTPVTGGTLTGTARGDFLAGFAGTDTLSGGAGDDVIADGAGADVLTGGAGADTFVLAYDRTPDRITDFEVGTDDLDLSAWPRLRALDQLFTDTTADGIVLRYGDEVLTLQSADGGPIARADLIAADIIPGTRLPDLPGPGFPGPVVTPDLPERPIFPDPLPSPRPDPDPREVIGSQGADTLRGKGGTDKIWGRAGNDAIYGEGGNDVLLGGSGADRIYGGPGDDILQGGFGRDMRWIGGGGESTANRLYGGTGNDQLWGQSGADLLDGQAGDDTLTGGGGYDTFIFREGRDRVTDFSSATDRLRLDDALWAGRLNERQVVERYAHDTGDDVVFDFGGGDRLTLEGVAGVSGLADVIDII